jgi:hypothetical protein
MGTSTDAILFYGYCWDAETDQPWTIDRDREDEGGDIEDEDWRDRYVRVMGLIADGDRASGARAYELTQALACEVSTHCSRECPMPLVAVTASLTRSRRGYMTEIRDLAVDPAWDGMLAEFCRVMGIRVDRLRPAWWLVSDWS